MGKPRDPEGLDLLGFKKCNKCDRWILRARFNNDKQNRDGLRPYCKRCHSEEAIKWHKEHQEAHREACTKWQKANLDKVAAYMRDYRKQPMRAWKEKIRRETKQLILQGLILHPGCCEDCGVVADSETTIHIHHLTYLRPDRVLFLCPQCHQRWHNENQSPSEPTQEWVEHWYETYNDYPEEE